GPAVRVLLVDESVPEERVQMVAGRADREIQGPRHGSEVVSRKSTEVVVDPTAHRMIQAGHQPEGQEERRRLRRDAHPECIQGLDDEIDRADDRVSARAYALHPETPRPGESSMR